MKKRKKTPTEVIGDSGDPSVEHAFIKYPGESPVDVSGEMGRGKYQNHFVVPSERKINDASVGKDIGKQKRRIIIHTHPFHTDESGKFGEPLHPSAEDVGNLFPSPNKTEVIAYRDQITGKVGGYLVMRKLKSKKDHDELERGAQGVHEYGANLQKVGVFGSPFYFRVRGNYKAGLQKGYDAALRKAAETVGFKYKYVPAEGYEFDMEKGGLVKKVEKRHSKPSKLESITATVSIIGLVASVIFLSFNITGNVIGSLNQTSSNWISGVLFLIGLVGAFAYFKRR